MTAKTEYRLTYKGAHVFISPNTNGVGKHTYSGHCAGQHLVAPDLDAMKQKIDALVPDTPPVKREHVYTMPILPRRPVAV